MDPTQPSTDETQEPERRWRPLTRTQRRVAGVLVEKAKTTPDAYPLTLNALTTGCNQKSNRSPQMTLSTDHVEQALEELREMGAAAEVQSSGRVAKFRHYLYDWLGVDKTEMAVLAELLLRGEHKPWVSCGGAQPGWRRSATWQALRPVLESLIAKELVLSLTPPGRGQVVSHNLYQDQELDAVRKRVSATAPPESETAPSSSAPVRAAPTATTSPPASSGVGLDEVTRQLATLSERLARLESRLDRLEG